MGIDRRMALVQDVLLGHGRPDHEPPARRHGLDGTLVPPGGTFSLNDGDRRANGRAWVPARAGDHRHRVRRGGRRRHLAGRDDGRSTPPGRPGSGSPSAIPTRLYISRYQLGRDATVYWPSLDLKFDERHEELGARQGLRRVRRDQHRDLRRRATPRRELARDDRPSPGAAPVERSRIRRSPRARRSSRRRDRRRAGRRSTRTIYDADGKLIRDRDVDDVVQGRDAGRPRRNEGRRRSLAASASLRPRTTKTPADTTRYAAADSAVAIASASHAGHARRAVRLAIDGRVASCSRRRRARRRARSGTRTRSARRARPRSASRRESFVEVGRAVVADEDLRRQRLDPSIADRLVAAGVRLEVGDARDLEPDDERGVMRDALRVRLREPDPHVRREREAVHGRQP